MERKGLRKIAEKLGLFSSGFKSDFKKSLGILIALVLVAIAITTIFVFLGLDDTASVGEAISQIHPLMLVYILTVGVAGEEVLFRGFLVPKIGILPSSFVFALFHALYGSVVEVIGAFVLGGLLAWAFKRNKTLFPNIYAHIGYNLIALALLR